MNKRSRTALTLSAVLAFAVTVSVMLFFIYILVLRTGYRSAALEINDAILSGSRTTISRGDETLPASAEVMDYYNRFLLDKYTIVYSRKAAAVTEDSIILGIGNSQLAFTGLEDGTAIAVKWETPVGEKNYVVRSQITFMQLSAYYENYKRRSLNPR